MERSSKLTTNHLAAYPDDFSDLTDKGWTVQTTPDDEGHGQILLVPPGFTDMSALANTPHVRTSIVNESDEGVTAKISVQSRGSEYGQRHPDFERQEWRAHTLAQRAFVALGADTLQFN